MQWPVACLSCKPVCVLSCKTHTHTSEGLNTFCVVPKWVLLASNLCLWRGSRDYCNTVCVMRDVCVCVHCTWWKNVRGGVWNLSVEGVDFVDLRTAWYCCYCWHFNEYLLKKSNKHIKGSHLIGYFSHARTHTSMMTWMQPLFISSPATLTEDVPAFLSL